ncbi:MAG TPA: hypothetical protein VH107_16225 [Lacipirellulaceae bacterium]|jgi:hypothetical protein|nr:hypothetical protein [Lacipirellulaceae bacterium]
MHVWPPISARSNRPTTVQEWAALEGKSETMREDLIRRYGHQTAKGPQRALSLVLLAKLILAAIAMLLHARSR